eukprot:1344653-Rhodomonas_salina.1
MSATDLVAFVLGANQQLQILGHVPDITCAVLLLQLLRDLPDVDHRPPALFQLLVHCLLVLLPARDRFRPFLLQKGALAHHVDILQRAFLAAHTLSEPGTHTRDGQLVAYLHFPHARAVAEGDDPLVNFVVTHAGDTIDGPVVELVVQLLQHLIAPPDERES